MLIPDVKIVLNHSAFELPEKFNTYKELEDFCFEIPDVRQSAFSEWVGLEIPSVKKSDEQEFKDYFNEHLKRLLDDCGYTIETKTAQDIAHDENEPCDEDDCQECCGEHYGHEYDTDEGGYCMCGANGYENGER